VALGVVPVIEVEDPVEGDTWVVVVGVRETKFLAPMDTTKLETNTK
jgi:hypothetical protein